MTNGQPGKTGRSCFFFFPQINPSSSVHFISQIPQIFPFLSMSFAKPAENHTLEILQDISCLDQRLLAGLPNFTLNLTPMTQSSPSSQSSQCNNAPVTDSPLCLESNLQYCITWPHLPLSLFTSSQPFLCSSCSLNNLHSYHARGLCKDYSLFLEFPFLLFEHLASFYFKEVLP